MGTGKDDLRAIMEADNDFSDPEVRKNFEALRAMLVSAKRDQEGTFDVDYGEISDLAFNVAHQLPDGVKVMGDHSQKEEPSWKKTFGLCAIIVGVYLVFFLIANNLGQLSREIENIAKRASFYDEAKVLPQETVNNAIEHYIADVGHLLSVIKELKEVQRVQGRTIHGQHKTIDNLKTDLETLQQQQKQILEKYDWHKEVFSPPRIVKNGTKKPRITDNRTP